MVEYDDLTDEQQRAVDALDRNVTLTSGAGTGKTTTLTARYLRMFAESIASEHPEYPDSADDDFAHLLPENVLTTTFTERAANELESNIRTEITELIASLDVDEFDAWRRIADELEHGYIHTVHGFCSRLLREHALTIDPVDPGFDTLDENDTAALVDDTVGTVLEEYETADAVRTLARRFSRSQLHKIVVDLLGERPGSLTWAERWADASESEYLAFVESEFHPIDPVEAAERLADEAFVEAATTLTEIVEDPPDIDTGGQVWGRAVGVVDRLDDTYHDGSPSPDKQALLAQLSMHLTTGDGERYAGYSGASTRWNGHPRKDEFDQAFSTLVDALQPENYAVSVDMELEANSFPFVSALAELTLIAADEYEQRKDRQNLVDFTDQIAYTVQFLSSDENEGIRQQLQDQFAYIMVDEFQDTDPRQWDLIKLLTAGDTETFDAENVFVVGDVKQSIYRFRNADVTVFRETEEMLRRSIHSDSDEATDSDQLSTNFRTLPTVLETINELFDAIFDENGEAYEAAPQRLSPHRDDPTDIGSVEYLAVPTNEEHRQQRFDHYEKFAQAEAGHDADLEAMALAARLSQVLSEPAQIYPESGEEATNATEQTVAGTEENDSGEEDAEAPRDIEPSDIAILIRSRTHLKKYERAVVNEGIPYSVASGIGFYESPEITALLNLFRALADPSDERALYAALRSPLFGLTDDTLVQLKLHDEPLWTALEASEDAELATAYESLREWRERAGLGDGHAGFDGSWAAYLTRILEDSGYLVSISADERPQQAVANVEKFREQLRDWTEDGIRSLTTLVSRLDRRIDLGGREGEADTTGEGVQILTIHDAKGMEFPFVVVPGIGYGIKDEASLGSGQVEFEKIGDQYAVGMKAPRPDDSFDMADTIARQTIRDQRRAEEQAEEKRVLYVACTRARDHLLLCGTHDLEGETETPTFTDIEEADPESPSSWRDWVQPELFTDDVCAALDDDLSVERTYGDGTYTITLPTPAGDWETDNVISTPAVELSPSPPSPETMFRLSAGDLATLYGSYGELQFDESTQTVYVEEVGLLDEQSPDARHGEESPDSQPGSSTRPTTADDIDPIVFGQMVHRICELRPPTNKWPDVMEQAIVDQGSDVELTPELQARVSTHARYGIDYVDAVTAEVDVERQYDELYVTAEFEHGEIAGYIDHLVVTPDQYHIIDYKTGSMTPEELEGDAEYYVNQMKAYAVALHQQGTGRSVRVSLVFTDIDDAWNIEWMPSEIDSLSEEIQSCGSCLHYS